VVAVAAAAGVGGGGATGSPTFCRFDRRAGRGASSRGWWGEELGSRALRFRDDVRAAGWADDDEADDEDEAVGGAAGAAGVAAAAPEAEVGDPPWLAA